MTHITVGTATLKFVEHPMYDDAHPGEDTAAGERCTMCAIAERPDTGERVLLWKAGEKNWTVSRADPEWARHREDFM
jgi:hypothetical protein